MFPEAWKQEHLLSKDLRSPSPSPPPAATSASGKPVMPPRTPGLCGREIASPGGQVTCLLTFRPIPHFPVLPRVLGADPYALSSWAHLLSIRLGQCWRQGWKTRRTLDPLLILPADVFSLVSDSGYISGSNHFSCLDPGLPHSPCPGSAPQPPAPPCLVPAAAALAWQPKPRRSTY